MVRMLIPTSVRNNTHTHTTADRLKAGKSSSRASTAAVKANDSSSTTNAFKFAQASSRQAGTLSPSSLLLPFEEDEVPRHFARRAAVRL